MCGCAFENFARRKIDFILNGGGNRLQGHLSLSFKNFSGESFMHRLELKNICVTTGSAAIQNVPKILMSMPSNGLTFGKKNTMHETKIIAEILKNTLIKK